MSKENIGSATRSPSLEEQYEGIAFTIPYGATGYDVRLEDSEMDLLLNVGLTKLLGNRAVSGFDYTIKMQGSDLPFYIGANSIQIDSNESGLHDTHMGVSVVSQSVVYEHRGILLASRRSWDGNWSLEDYITQPPLKYQDGDPEVVHAPEAQSEAETPKPNRRFVSRLLRLAKDFDGTISQLPPEMRQKYVDERNEARAHRARNDISTHQGRY